MWVPSIPCAYAVGMSGSSEQGPYHQNKEQILEGQSLLNV